MLPILAALFFGSGLAALVYQVVWLRLLGLVFGVTVYAAATVLSTFMAGLALGSVLAGRLADSVRRPLVWFAAAEAGVGLTALASPALLAALQRGYVALDQRLPESLAAITAARVAMAALTLVVPTVLMGATLPLVIRSSLTTSSSLGPRIGVLYASNTAGAIAGTLVAALFLIPSFGLSRSLLSAACINFLVAAFAGTWGLRRTIEPSLPPGADLGTGAPDRAGLRRAVLAVFALSGFIALAAEVVWFRVAVLIIRPTVYSFGVMLATVLGGIALGSYIVAPFLRATRDWVAVLIALELLLGVALCLGPPSLALLPQASRAAHPWLAMMMPEHLPYLVVASLLMIFPSALLMGAAFPIGALLYTQSQPQAARRIGRFYAVNVCAGIAGSLAAGFVMLPWLGSRTSVLVLGALTLVSALVLLPELPAARRRAAYAMSSAAAAAMALFAAWIPDPQGIYLRQRFRGQRIIWSEEGVQSTVSVHEFGGNRALHIDGNHQASTMGSTVTVHRRIALLGMALHPNPREVLIIGLGGGATAGAASQFPFAHVDVVELSGPVVRAARFFNSINQGVLERPNVSLRVDDGRNYLLLTDRRYDVIAADLILPIHAGAGNVYSEEYFRLARRALKDDGLIVQWVAGTRKEYELIARTFITVFPHTTLWAEGSLLVGSKRPLTVRRADLEWKLQVPEAREALRSLGLDRFDVLKRQFTASADELRALVGPGPTLTDDRPLVEYFLALRRDEAIDMSRLRGTPAPFLD